MPVFKTGINAVLSQNNHPIEFFSEKLKQLQVNYSLYDVKLYAVVHSLYPLSHYLKHREYILNLDHESLKYLDSQSKKSTRQIHLSNEPTPGV